MYRTYAQGVGELQVDEHREDFQQRLGMFALQILVCTLFFITFESICGCASLGPVDALLQFASPDH